MATTTKKGAKAVA